MGEGGVLGLQALHHLAEGDQLLDGHLRLLLVDVHDLELAVAVLRAGLEDLEELLLVGLDGGPWKEGKERAMKKGRRKGSNTSMLQNALLHVIGNLKGQV